MKKKVLDKGYVSLIDWMGDDLSPVNEARVSFDKSSDELTERDKRLLNFLGREGHTSPFRGSILKFEVYAPLLVARQWWRYVVGSDHAESPEHSTDRFLQWNESSRRYVTEGTEFYLPGEDEWREAPANSKQGSGKFVNAKLGRIFTELLLQQQLRGEALYDYAIRVGIAPEQARLFLPAYGLYVRWRWTASLQAVSHLVNQRVAKDAQKEFQEYARAVRGLTTEVFPHSMEALTKEQG